MRKLKHTLTNTKLNKSNKLLGLCFISIAACITLAYYPALNNQFVQWDDQFYVTANPLLLNPSLSSLRALMTTVISLNYHPITMASLWANAWFSGLDAAYPFILSNLIIHILNSILVLLLVYSITNKNLVVALVTSMIFGIHPMHVESVVWVSERKDVLYGLFFLLSLLIYWGYIKSSKYRYLIVSFVLFLMSCLSKAMAVSLVPCLVLLDYYVGRSFKTLRIYVEKIPFIATGMLIGLIAITIQSGDNVFGLLTHTITESAIVTADISILEKLKNASFANYFYLTQFVNPSKHAAFHPYSIIDQTPIWLTLSVALSLCGIFLWSFLKGYKEMVFALGFYVITILLVLQLIPVGSAIVAERYTYLPYLGLAFLVGVGLSKIWKSNIKIIAPILLCAVLMILIPKTKAQSVIWRDHISLFSQAVNRYPEDSFARKTLATGYWNAGELDSAIYHATFAIDELGLVTSAAFELLANCYADAQKPKEAIAFFNEAVRLDSNNVIARYHRGLQLLTIDSQKAILDFNFCEQSSNSYVKPLIYTPRGRAYGVTKQYDKAIADFTKAIELAPKNHYNYLDRAVTYQNMGQLEKAKADRKHAQLIAGGNI